MSRILRNKRVWGVGFGCLLLLLSLLVKNLLLMILGCLLIILIIADFYAYKKIMRQMEPFQTRSKIRNVDYLVIGDMVDAVRFVPKGKSYVSICAPERSLFSCIEILQHTSSILNESGGNVLFFYRNSSMDPTSITLFDFPFLSEVAMKKLGLSTIRKRMQYPLLYSPIKTSMFLANRGGTRPGQRSGLPISSY